MLKSYDILVYISWMNIEEIRDYCLAKPGTSEDFPFDETTLVFRGMGKMFALTGLDIYPLYVNLKCDPPKADHRTGGAIRSHSAWLAYEQSFVAVDLYA